MGKTKDKIRVSFKDSGSSENVTGSCIVITWKDKTILLDCGLIQGNYTLLQEYKANDRKTSFKAKDVNYIFLSHTHADHIGLVPKMVQRGFKGSIIVPKGSKIILKEMWLDSAKILARDALDLTKRFKKFYEPIYTEEDVYKALELVRECEFEKKIKLEEDLEFQFFPAGHIVLSSQIILYIRNHNTVKKIGYTGDLGNLDVPNIFNNEFKPIPGTNLLIGESTYGNKQRSAKAKDRDKDLEKLKSEIREICIEGNRGGKGKILIPTFSLQRTQQMIKVLYDLYKDDKDFNIPVYVCSPLACRICNKFYDILEGEQLEQWEECSTWKRVEYIDNFERLEELLGEDRPMIFLASSGMLDQGYSKVISKVLLPKQNSSIVFCGYSVEGSLAFKIKQGCVKTINIDGKHVKCKCGVVVLNSFSSHAQNDTLVDYYSGKLGTGFYGKVALVHGEMKDKIELGREVQKYMEVRNRTDKVIIVNKSTEILL